MKRMTALPSVSAPARLVLFFATGGALPAPENPKADPSKPSSSDAAAGSQAGRGRPMECRLTSAKRTVVSRKRLERKRLERKRNKGKGSEVGDLTIVFEIEENVGAPDGVKVGDEVGWVVVEGPLKDEERTAAQEKDTSGCRGRKNGKISCSCGTKEKGDHDVAILPIDSPKEAAESGDTTSSKKASGTASPKKRTEDVNEVQASESINRILVSAFVDKKGKIVNTLDGNGGGECKEAVSLAAAPGGLAVTRSCCASSTSSYQPPSVVNENAPEVVPDPPTDPPSATLPSPFPGPEFEHVKAGLGYKTTPPFVNLRGRQPVEKEACHFEIPKALRSGIKSQTLPVLESRAPLQARSNESRPRYFDRNSTMYPKESLAGRSAVREVPTGESRTKHAPPVMVYEAVQEVPRKEHRRENIAHQKSFERLRPSSFTRYQDYVKPPIKPRFPYIQRSSARDVTKDQRSLQSQLPLLPQQQSQKTWNTSSSADKWCSNYPPISAKQPPHHNDLSHIRHQQAQSNQVASEAAASSGRHQSHSRPKSYACADELDVRSRNAERNPVSHRPQSRSVDNGALGRGTFPYDQGYDSGRELVSSTRSDGGSHQSRQTQHMNQRYPVLQNPISGQSDPSQRYSHKPDGRYQAYGPQSPNFGSPVETRQKARPDYVHGITRAQEMTRRTWGHGGHHQEPADIRYASRSGDMSSIKRISEVRRETRAKPYAEQNFDKE